MWTRWTLAGLVCLCLVEITIGGAPQQGRETEDGTPCSFPFTVDGHTYYDCTKYKWDHEWCATTKDFNKDKKWGNCKPRLSAAAGLVASVNDPCSPPPNRKGLIAFAGSYNGNCSEWWQPCKIPFTFEGKTYYSCTTDGYRLNLPWCSLVTDWVTGQPWGICHDTTERNDPCSWIEVSGAVKDANVNGFYYRLNDDCNTGYPVATWRKCTLPSSANSRFIQLTNNQNYLRWSISTRECREYDVAYTRDYRTNPPIPNNPYDPSLLSWYEWFNNAETVNGNMRVTCLNSFEESCTCDKCACTTVDNCQCTQSCSGGGGGGTSCTDTFIPNRGMHSMGGLEYVGVTTQVQCLSLCLVNDTCMAFDIDMNIGKCFFHIGMSYKDFQSAAVGVDQYERKECTTTTSTPTGTTRPGACQDSFQPYPNKHGFGAEIDATATTLTACETSCLNQPSCLAFEYDISNNNCWIHKSAANLDPLQDTTTTGVLTHYRRVKCTTTPAHPGTTSGGCQDTFEELLSRYSFDGTEITTAKTLDACKQACRDDDNCVGLDWNIGNQGCYLHFDKVTFEQRHDSRGAINQYVRKPCDVTTGMTVRTTGFPTGTGCVDTFHELKKHNAPGGSRQNGVSNNADCAAECLKSVTCVGYDYNWVDDDCYLFFDKDKADKTQFNPDVHHYTRQPCVGGTTTAPGGCQDEFKEYLRHQTVGGEQYTGTVTTVSDCLRACIASDCYGIDWDQQNPSQPTCWLHRSEKNFLGRKPVNADINSYELIHRCQDTTVVTGVHTTTVGPTDCPNAWQKMPDTKVNGAQQYPAASTVETCQKACRDQTDCNSIDFNHGTAGVTYRCWLHTKEISANDYLPATDVDHYKYTGCPKMKCIYHLYADTKVVGAKEQTSMALEACQNSCTADVTCLALDFVPANNGCWLHYDAASLSNRQNAAGVNHYVKECKEQCEDDFIGYENFNVQGAEMVSGVSNLDACKDACSNNAECVGIDFNTMANTCWMHKDAAKIQTRNPANGINHYVIQRCDEGCKSEWELYDNQNVQGGTKAAGVNNLDDCKKACDDLPDCLAIDYNVRDAACWTHSDPNKLASRKAMNGVDHLVIKRCSECINTYDRYNNTNVIGGTAKKEYSTAVLCRNACYNDLTCLAFDFVRRIGTVVVRCWFHYDAAVLANRQHKPEVDHYVIKRCTEVCVNQYTKNENRHVNGGTEKAGPTVPSECQVLCDAEPSCTGFDFDTRQNQYAIKCYLHYTVDPALQAMNGVDHYILTTKCTGTTITTPIGCRDEFTANPNTHSTGGKHTPGASTLDLCKEACSAIANCLGLDWTSGSQCWLHVDTIGQPLPFNGVTQYKIQRCSDTCKDTFNPHPDMHASNGKFEAGGTTLDLCKQLCSQDDRCVAIDWNGNSNVASKCFVHLDSVGQLTPLSGVTHFTITRCTSDCTMVEYKNGRAASGDNVGFYPNDFNQCRMACESQPQCKSVDWNKSTGACFIHTGTSGFILDSCCKRMVKICGNCVDQFIEIPNKNALGGQPAGSADEIEECKQQCRASTTCESFDFNSQNQPPQPRCYLHSQVVTSLLSNPAVSHYQRGFCLPPVGTPPTGQTTTAAMNTPTQYPSDCVADIVFLIDDSGSIIDAQGQDTGNNRNPAMWVGVKNFLRTIAANIDIGTNSNRLAAVRFSNTGIVDFRLNQIQTNQYVDTTLANLAFTGGLTNTHAGLQAVRSQVFTQAGGDRPLVKNIVVIFTDGKNADSVLLTGEINTMRSIAKVFVVGVTAMINHVGLIHLTSIPSEDHLFFMSDLTTFVRIFTNVVTGSCQTSVTPAIATTSQAAPQPFQCNAAFTVARTTPAPPAFPLIFPLPLLNFGSLVAGGRFISPGNCIYYVTLCVGVPAQGKINYALIRPNGWPAFNVYRTSISHNGIDMASRDGLISINQNQPLSIKTTLGNIHSGAGMHTSWSAMSFTDASSLGESYFYVTQISDFSHTGNTIDFTEFDLRSSDNSFDRINSRYRCPATGFYFFSYSVGLQPGQGARVQLKGGSRTVELTRTSTSHNGFDTMSRAVLLQCNVGSFVWLHLEQGVLASNTDRQTSFLGFRYNPAGQSVAWSAYRTSAFAIGGAANYLKISYTEVAINIGNAFDVSNHRVRIPRKGIYLIHWSVGVQTGNNVDVMLFKNGQPLAAISREATNHNGLDTMSRSLVLEMNYNDMLEIFASQSSAGLYSDAYRQTSFLGMLINPL